MMPLLITVPLFRFLILFLLLLGAGRICMQPSGYLRMLMGSWLGAIYAALCLLPGFERLGHGVMYHLVLLFVAFLCFGFQGKGAFSFIFLNLILDGLIEQTPTVISIVLFSVGVVGMLIVFMTKRNHLLLPVTLRHRNKTLSFYALYDTGNTLKDPTTGTSVLVVSPVVARELTGLTLDQLKDPVNSIGLLPGLRLIPYKSVGRSAGFMLGMLVQEVRIGKRKCKRVVAFAPEVFEESQRYQALAGGIE